MRGRQLGNGPRVHPSLLPSPPTPGKLSEVPTELFSKVSSSVVVLSFIWTLFCLCVWLCVSVCIVVLASYNTPAHSQSHVFWTFTWNRNQTQLNNEASSAKQKLCGRHDTWLHRSAYRWQYFKGNCMRAACVHLSWLLDDNKTHKFSVKSIPYFIKPQMGPAGCLYLTGRVGLEPASELL